MSPGIPLEVFNYVVGIFGSKMLKEFSKEILEKLLEVCSQKFHIKLFKELMKLLQREILFVASKGILKGTW